MIKIGKIYKSQEATKLTTLMDNFKIEELYVDYVPRKNTSEKKIKFYHIFVAWFEILKIKFF